MAWFTAQDIILNYINGETITIIIFHPLIGGPYTLIIPGPDSHFNANLIGLLSILANSDFHSGDILYEWLLLINESTLGMFDMPDDVGVFPHMLLLAKLLHGYDGPELVDSIYYETHFFETAPPCGAYHYNNSQGSTLPPWHTMSLFYPWDNEPGWREDGDYPMLDYMLMYDAYFCDYYDYPKPYLYITESFYPGNSKDKGSDMENDTTSGIRGTEIIPLDPLSIVAARQIDAINLIHPGAQIQYNAGSEINLLPGFHAEHNCEFIASIDPDLNYPIYYVKTSTDPCGKKSLASGKAIDKPLPDPSNIFKTEINSSSDKSVKSNVSQKIFNPLSANEMQFKESDILVFPNPSSGILVWPLINRTIL